MRWLDFGYLRFLARLWRREAADRWVRRLAGWLPREVALQVFVRVYAAGWREAPGPEYVDVYKAWDVETKARRSRRREVWRVAGSMGRGALLVGAALLAGLLSAFLVPGCARLPSPFLTLQAQTLPYTLTVAWDVSPDAATYNCYLDGVVQRSGVTVLQCSFPVASLGAHVVTVTAVNPAFVPPESDPGRLAFTLKNPAAPGGVKVR